MRVVRYNRDISNDALDRVLSRSLHMNPDLVKQVAEIVEGGGPGGDEALVHYRRELDGVALSPQDLQVEEGYLRELASRADMKALGAFRKAIGNVRRFHERQRESPWLIDTECGSRV